MCGVHEFCLLERIKDGVVVWVSSKPWSPAEAKQYAEVAASQGETYHIVPCEVRRECPIGQPPTKAISFLPVAS